MSNPFSLNVRTDETWEDFIILLGNTILEDHGLDTQDWTIKFIDSDDENDDGSAGYCWHRGRVIFITREYLLNTDQRNVTETILHEVAHALRGNGHHDREFFDKLKEIGGTGLWIANGKETNYPVKEKR